jgi:hypothetical protein
LHKLHVTITLQCNILEHEHGKKET